MPEIGNVAKLVNSQTCQGCAKCCKEFHMSSDIDLALRFLWMERDDIKVKDTPFFLSQDQREATVCFKHGCSQLVEENGWFSCKAWNKERPGVCNTYPDHVFWHISSWNKEYIKKALRFERERCPGLAKVTVNDVVAMLKERRKEN